MIFADLEVKINTQKGNEILLLKKDPDFDSAADSTLSEISMPEKTVLVIGVFHGDEPDGQYLIERYLSKRAQTKNRLLFIPCLNPDGLAAKTRTNASKVDLNRNFPAKNWEKNEKLNPDGEENIYYGGDKPACEAETQFIIYVIEKYKPDLIITLHEPYSVVNYDGPAKDIAQKISQITGYKVEESIGYPTPGSFGTYCGAERNIAAITLELPENSEKESLWNTTKGIFEYISSEF